MTMTMRRIFSLVIVKRLVVHLCGVMVRWRLVVLVTLLLFGTLATVLVYQFSYGSENRTKFLPSYSKRGFRQKGVWTAESQAHMLQEADSNLGQTENGEGDDKTQFNHSRESQVAHQSHILPEDLSRQLENNQQDALRLREERRRLDGEFFQLKQEKRKLEGERRKLEEGQKALRLQRQLLEEDRKQLAVERIYSHKKQKQKPLESSAGKHAATPTAQDPNRLKVETPGGEILQQAAPPPDQLWEGLDPAYVARRYPGVMLDGDYVLRPFIDLKDERATGMGGNPHSIGEMTDGEAEERFYQLVTVDHIHCGDRRRMGNFGDGGWDMCVSGVYKPKQNCLVYSFGINNDFSFDDAIANKYGCQVKAFDPSMAQSGYSRRSNDMSVGDHMHSSRVYFYNLGLGATDGTNSQGWQLRTLGSILKRLNHQDTVIDYLKVDIEFNEWACFKTTLRENSLKNVKQFVFEIHTSELYNVNKPSRKETFYDWYNTLLGIEKQGFRRYNHHYNPNGQYTSVRTGKERTCCYELYYINIRFLNMTKT